MRWRQAAAHVFSISAALVLACAPPREARSLAACYRFDAPYFTWATYDTALGRHPGSSATIQLDTTPNLVAHRLDPNAFVARVPGLADARELERRALFSYWVPRRGGRLRLRWHNGYHGPLFDLEARGDSLVGGFSMESDAGGSWSDLLPWWLASRFARASRVPCAQ